MKTLLRTLLITTIAAAAAMNAVAQDDPMEAPGFVANKAYDVHDYDSVNMMSGNLTVSIPIGPAFHVNGALRYGLALHSNSRLWYWHFDEFSPHPPSCNLQDGNPKWTQNCGVTTAVPAHRFNAALGWTLSLGRILIGVTEGAGGVFSYEDPDGATHTFTGSGGTDSYSTDGSNLRMIAENGLTGTIYIDSPDGVRRTFESKDVALLSPSNPTRPMLTRIEDATGNHVDIDYDNHGLLWTIHDVAHDKDTYPIKVTFASGGPNLQSVLSSVVMPGPRLDANSNPINVTYSFETTSIDVQFPDRVTNQGSVSVPVLTKITRPTGQPFTFGTSSLPAYDMTSESSAGCLLGMTIPTGAKYTWTYSEAYVPRDSAPTKPGIEHPPQVASRTVPDPITGTPTTWSYQYGGFMGTNCQVLTPIPMGTVGAVKRPDGTIEASYYSVYQKPICSYIDQFNNAWDRNDFGLPFTKGMTLKVFDFNIGPVDAKRVNPTAPDPANPRDADIMYLSSQTYDRNGVLLESRYVSYEGDTPRSFGTRPNARAYAETTYQEGVTCLGGPCYSSINRSDYRNFGNYATAITTATDLTSKKSRTAFHDFHKTVDTYRWTLGDPNEECVLDGAVAGINECLGTSGAFITLFDYDRQRGLLNGKRILRQSGPNPQLDSHDILVHYLYGDPGDTDNYGTNGNLTKRKTEGGDTGSLDTTSRFPYSESVPLVIDHVNIYVNGALAGVTSSYDGTGFNLSDFTLQPQTGIIKSSRDSAGLETKYAYDDLGRLTTVIPPGGSTTTYAYHDTATPLSIDATTTQNATNTSLKHLSYEYDSLGRLWHEKTWVNNGWSTRTTRYDEMSRVNKTSPLQTGVATCDTSADNCTVTTFDSLGRPSVVTDPDNRTTTFSYLGNLRTTRTQVLTDSSSATTVETYDEFGQLASVTDPVLTTGTYGYDAASHLTNVVVTDPTQPAGHPKTQTRTFTYDGRGFLISETHPENGTVNYEYDAGGKVTAKRLPSTSIFDLNYDYDNAERILHVFSGNGAGGFRLMKEFTYGADHLSYGNKPDYSNGKLASAMRHNYQASGDDVQVVEKYHYADDAGRLTDRTTEIRLNGTLKQSLKQSAAYNEVGLVTNTVYPDCLLDNGTSDNTLPPCLSHPTSNVTRTYEEGRETNVVGFAAMTYSANEMLNTITHANGTKDTIDPDPKGRPRPNAITVTGPTATTPPPTCTAPHIVTQPASQTIQSGGSVTLTVSATGTSPGYQWFMDGTSISGATTSSYTTGPLTTTHSFSVTATNSCGSEGSSAALITVQPTCQAPQITTQPSSMTISLNQSVVLTVGASGSNLTYTWFEFGNGSSYLNLGPSSSPTLRTLPLSHTMEFWVHVQNGCGADAWSEVATIRVVLPAAQNVVASPASNGVLVTWSLLSSQQPVHHYSIERRAPNLNPLWVEIATASSTATSFTDGQVNMGYAAAYRVRAVEQPNYDGAMPNYGAYSNVDSAARATFDAIPAYINAAPLEQLRIAVNEIRVAAGLTPVIWPNLAPQDDQPQPGAVVAAAHILSLRVALDNGLAVLTVPVTPYTDQAFQSSTLVKRIHLTDLQDHTK